PHVAGDDAARGEEEARGRDDAAPASLRGVGGVAPERIVVADAVGVMADAVARRLVAPRLERVGDLDTDAFAEGLEALGGGIPGQRSGPNRASWHAGSPGRAGPCGGSCPPASGAGRPRRRRDAGIRAGSGVSG